MKRVDPTLCGHMQGDHLGLRFREARKFSGLSRKDAALLIGLTDRHLGRIEAGGVQMVSDPATIVRAAEAYGVPQVWLYAGAAGGARFVPEWYRTT